MDSDAIDDCRVDVTVSAGSRPAEPERIDPWEKVEALVVALDALLRAGMIEQARPVADQLLALARSERRRRVNVADRLVDQHAGPGGE
jgi:hypothetical protein